MIDVVLVQQTSGCSGWFRIRAPAGLRAVDLGLGAALAGAVGVVLVTPPLLPSMTPLESTSAAAPLTTRSDR